MNKLATNSVDGGKFLFADADNNGLALRKKYREAIQGGLDLDPTVDPEGVVSRSQPEARHQISVLPYDSKVAFTVDWETRGAPIHVSLLTPLGETIEEPGFESSPPFFYRSSRFHRVFVFDDAFLKNRGHTPRYGAWTLIVRYQPGPVIGIAAAAAVQSERYQYEAIVESRLKLRLSFDRPFHEPRDRIGISGKLTLDGKGITNASVKLEAGVPGQAAHNFIARSIVPADVLAKAKEALKNEDSTAVGVKALALELNGSSFNEFRDTHLITMTDPDNIGVYSAGVDTTSVPGTYDFYAVAIGVTNDGVAFRREQRLTRRVQVVPRPEFTLVNIVYRTGAADVCVTPGDEVQNCFMFDPAVNPRISLTSTVGQFASPLTFNGDGSYTGTLTYPPGSNPVISVGIDGTPVIPAFPLQPVEKLIWVDRVVEFKAGAEAAPGSNTHATPDAALGSPLSKPPDRFVSLGGLGSLTVAIKNHSIGHQGSDDITVFVQPDQNLRPYRVEVLAERFLQHDKWVLIGRSPGITESFSLGDISEAEAIRITDESGAIRDQAHKPLSTPGVSIRAVGIKTTDTSGDGGGVCLRLKVLNALRAPLGGTVDLEFRPQGPGPFRAVKGVDASKDIDVKGLQRTPQGLYLVTVIPTVGRFRPTGQFVTIPASGFATAEFVIPD